MRRTILLLALAGPLLNAVAAPLPPQPATASAPAKTSHAILPGAQADGSVLLHNGWSIHPAGAQIELADFPVNVAVHPGGHFAAVLHAGYGPHQIIVVDLDHARVISRTPLSETFYGLEFTADGRQLFCSGASDEAVDRFQFEAGALTHRSTFPLRDPAVQGVPAGLALDAAAAHLYVANLWGDRVSRVDLSNGNKVTEITLGPNTQIRTAPASKSGGDDDSAVQVSADDTFPYACALDENHQRLYVSLWAKAAIAVIDLKSSRVVARWPTEEHPCEMALTKSGQRLYVANANRNTVTVIDTATGRAVETIWAALYPQSPPGSTPNSLALSPDEHTLFVANADINAIAVFDIGNPGSSRSLGFIPAGWYPTSVRATPDGRHLLVANGRGVVTRANPKGPQPGLEHVLQSSVQYIGGLYRGTLSIIDLPARDKLEDWLKTYTAQTYACSPLNAEAGVTATPAPGNPIPSRPGDPSPIRYCIYIIKENRTYDQVLGDMPEGNGDASLCLFPEKTTPNHHQLARQFVLLDNFYVNAQVSADGHEWSMGAYASDFVAKTWPLNYGRAGAGHATQRAATGGKFPYPSEGSFPLATPAGGYLWDRAREAGVSYRSYGEFIANGARPTDPGRAKVKALEGHFDPMFRSFDLGYPDAKRADRFISELQRFEKEGDMPRLQIVRLPNDHTHGATLGFPTPAAYAADNDGALGRLVEAVSHSKFWPQTAIFVVEDDAQNGPDHVDAHRTVALVVSPYTMHHAVDSTLYATTSMMRTIELILGLKPMSQFDAAATPMFQSFQAKPELTPYDALPVNVNLNAKNTADGWGATTRMNFAREDAVDDLLLSEAVWRAVRGRNSPMPAPVHAGFVFPSSRGDDD